MNRLDIIKAVAKVLSTKRVWMNKQTSSIFSGIQDISSVSSSGIKNLIGLKLLVGLLLRILPANLVRTLASL